jgi:hypothetical protein
MNATESAGQASSASSFSSSSSIFVPFEDEDEDDDEVILRGTSSLERLRCIEKPNAFPGFQQTDEFDEQNHIEPMAQSSGGIVCLLDGGL